MSWDDEFSANASKQLKVRGPSAAKKVTDYLDKRVKDSADPRAFGKPLRGYKKGYWRYRVEDFRIIATIEDRRLFVTVVKVGNRRDVYE